MKLSLLLTATLLCLTSAFGAQISFSNITSTNVVKTNDALLVNSDLGGGNWATRQASKQTFLGDPFEFTSMLPDNATNVAWVVDTKNTWSDPSTGLMFGRHAGTNVLTVGVGGQIVSGAHTLDFWGTDLSGAAFISSRETSKGDYWYYEIVNRVAQDDTHYGIFESDIETNRAYLNNTVIFEGARSGFATLAVPNDIVEAYLYVGGNAKTYFGPLAGATDPAYTLDTAITHTAGKLLNVGNNGTNMFTVGHLGAIQTGGNTNLWSFNGKVVGATVALTATNYLEIVLNGVTNKVALVQ